MRRITFSVWVVLVSLLAGLSFGDLFKDGDTVCFLGDSITNGGRYQGMIYDYYLTRFPGWTLHFVHAGRSGDSAGGSLSRLKEDVIDKRPTAVAIMFGMNDVGRGNYVAEPNESQKASQRRSLEGYKVNMEKLIGRIRAEAYEPKLFCITPSPFDQTMINDRNNNQPGCNDGLGKCAEIVRGLAAKNNGVLVDYYGPMTALNRERQKKDPTDTIIGPDRVHPGAAGHLMMAWLFLKAQGAPSLVSKVVVDASAGRVGEAVNAEVSAVSKKAGGISFIVLEKALPFPVDSAAEMMLKLLPIERDLNQELLTVSGLASGYYALKIDEAVVGQYTADDLAHGINLAFNVATPQYRQAQKIAKKNDQRRLAECEWRGLLNTRRWMISHYKIQVDDPAAVQAHYDRFTDKKAYSAVMALNYIKNWPRYDAIIKQAAEYERDVLQNRMPTPHAYEVLPVSKAQ